MWCYYGNTSTADTTDGHGDAIGVITELSTGQLYVLSLVSLSSTSGELVVITGDNLGYHGSVVTVTINGSPCLSPLVINSNEITCSAPPGAGQNLVLAVTVANQVVSSPTFAYAGPAISSISQVGTAGGVIMITGTNFGTDLSQINVTLGGQSCASLVLTTAHITLSCNVTSGVGSLVAYVAVAGQTTSSTFTYFPPTLATATPVSTRGGLGR